MAYVGDSALSICGWAATPAAPITPIAVNHTLMTGPNIRPTAPVPSRCTRNRPTMIAAVIGTTRPATDGAATLTPSTDDRTDMAGVITPAISVLSSVEGVKVAAPSVAGLVVPITAAIIVGLFLVQRLGTGAVGRMFGPVMSVWFTAIGVIGAAGVAAHPQILKALSPTYAIGFLFGHFPVAFYSLAAVVLAVTGAEALYADMGHLGRAGIRVRHGGDRHDHHHDPAVLLHRPVPLALAVVGRRPGRQRPARH